MALRILVVDTYPSVRELLTILLRAWGHVVETVTTGGEARSKAAAFQPEVAILDLGITDVEPTVLAAELGAARVPPFLLATSTEPDDPPMLLAGGFYRCLRKPCDLDELKAVLADLHSGASRRRAKS
jgi:DNA-binding response OmpR family regulator